MIGLGRMGANMVRRLMAAGHTCVVYDVNTDAVQALAKEGATPAYSPEELVAALKPPRALWIMVPAAFVDSTIETLAPLLKKGDTIIDGGNSYYRDDLTRSAALATQGVNYLDIGTSGGVFGRERGYCMMVGGDANAVKRLAPALDSLAPGSASAPRTKGRKGKVTQEEKGWLHCGPSGAGHFVKMVHNGIEYGLMAAYAEGFNILATAGIGRADQQHDAETTPLRDPHAYQYQFDLGAISELWRRGSVVSSWLMDLTAQALHDNPNLEGFNGHVSDSGEGRWTALAAIDEGVPAPVITAALFSRFSSRGNDDTANKLLSAMRQQFGGHHEKRS